MSIEAILTSGEFWAAGFGAAAAFILEALRTWKAQRRSEVASVNLALLMLAQMYAVLTNIKQQAFDEPTKRIEREKRAPLAIEYLPMIGVSSQGIRIDLASLSFLLKSHDPDILNRLAAGDRDFQVNLENEQHRSRLQFEVQDRLSDAGIAEGKQFTLAAIRAAAGNSRMRQLETSTDSSIAALPAACKLLLTLHHQLVAVAKLHFPTGRFVRFEPIATTPIVDHVPKGRARMWRHLLRWATDKGRTPLLNLLTR